MKLDKLYELPFNQTAYLLKEAIIGLERLFNKFGGFEVLPSMIVINEKGQCKVWYNDNSHSNMIRPAEIT